MNNAWRGDENEWPHVAQRSMTTLPKMTSRYDEIMKTKPYLPYNMGYLTEAMVKKAEVELGETDHVKAKTIPELRKMVENEPKLVCPTDDAYMLQYLRARKFNVKKAFGLLQNYYHVKQHNGDLYNKFDREALEKANREKILACLPYRDEDGCVIYMIKMRNWDTDIVPIGEGMIGLTVGILFCVEDVATQVCGVRLLLDVKGASLKQVRCITPRYMSIFSKALRNCLPVRFKGVHLYNETFIFGYFWSVFKFFLSDKIRNRVHFHGDNQKHLHRVIPKAILPSEYGGDNSEFSSSNWYNKEIDKFFDRYKVLTTYGYRG